PIFDPVQLTINPGTAASLAVDKSSAIPGDTLKYTALVTNPTATFCMGGYIDAESVASAEATVAYYWDQLEICATGCGNGLTDPHWTGVVAFETGQSGYQPIQPPSVHTGMTFAAQPYTDQETFGNPFTTMSNPAAIHGVTVTFSLPDGTTSAVGPAQVPALGLLNPGGSVAATTTYRVPVPGARPASESERAYTR